PLFGMDEAYVEEVYGGRALELVLGNGNSQEKILDVMRRADYYAGNVYEIRACLAAQYSYVISLGAVIEIVKNQGAEITADLASGAIESVPAVGLRPASRREEHPDSRMKLRYGFNETLGWRPFALGPGREQIWARLRDVQTRIVRIFAFAQYTPDPATEWE